MKAVICNGQLCFITAVKFFFTAGGCKCKKEDKQYVKVSFQKCKNKEALTIGCNVSVKLSAG